MSAQVISPPLSEPLYYPTGARGCSNGDVGADHSEVGVFMCGPQIWEWKDGQTRPLAPDIKQVCYDPKLSPDGRWCAFVLVDARNQGQIVVIDRNTNQRFQLTNTVTGSNRMPWCDYFDGDLWLGWLSNAVDLTTTKSTSNESAIIYRFRDGYLRVASWGPNGIFNGQVVTQCNVGMQTLFDSDATNTGFENHGYRQIYFHNQNNDTNLLISRNARGVVVTTGENVQPRGSADGRRIVWQSRAPELISPANAGSGNGEVFVSDLHTGRLYACSPFRGESADPVISPDGLLVAFETNAPEVPGWQQKPGTMSSFIYELETGRYTRLNDPIPSESFAIYGGGHPRIANDGSAVFNSDVPDGIWRVLRFQPEALVA